MHPLVNTSRLVYQVPEWNSTKCKGHHFAWKLDLCIRCWLH